MREVTGWGHSSHNVFFVVVRIGMCGNLVWVHCYILRWPLNCMLDSFVLSRLILWAPLVEATQEITNHLLSMFKASFPLTSSRNVVMNHKTVFGVSGRCLRASADSVQGNLKWNLSISVFMLYGLLSSGSGLLWYGWRFIRGWRHDI